MNDFHSGIFDSKIPVSIIRFMKIQQSMNYNRILNGLAGSTRLHFAMRK